MYLPKRTETLFLKDLAYRDRQEAEETEIWGRSGEGVGIVEKWRGA